MTADAADAAATACRQALEAIARAGTTSALELGALAAAPAAVVEAALSAFANDRGAEALPTLTRLAAERTERAVRRAARRALYRLAQRGIAPAPVLARHVVARQPERAVRAWMSAIDGSGSRATWLVFEGAYGGLRLCSLIVNDEVGVMEVAGGDITKKRLDRELETLRAEQKLPWVEAEPARALGLVREALALHTEHGTAPPGDFERWRRLFDGAAAPAPDGTAPDAPVDEGALDRAAELLELPEMAGWFLDPESVQSDALEILQARESRLVVSDQIKSEREEAIVDHAIERAFTAPARARWARRLREMAWIFEATGQAEPARLAEHAAAAFADPARDARRHPMARAMVRRALELAGEVALGRVSAAEVSRKPSVTGVTSPGPGATSTVTSGGGGSALA
jgi:hypothetical protein